MPSYLNERKYGVHAVQQPGGAQASRIGSPLDNMYRASQTGIQGIGGSMPQRFPLWSAQQDAEAKMRTPMTNAPQVSGPIAALARDMGPGYQDRLMRRQTGVRPGMEWASRNPPPNAVQQARAQGLGGSMRLDPRNAALNAYLMGQ